MAKVERNVILNLIQDPVEYGGVMTAKAMGVLAT
jgi:hypothetical protein